MEYRPLGRTGLKISALSLGCFNFGRRADQRESSSMLHRALDAGINAIDTADSYAAGASEQMVGAALAETGARSRVLLTTKVHFPVTEGDVNSRGNSRRYILAACDASLRRLRTDWIDVYMVHRPAPDTAIDETLGALDDLIRAGKVRYAGTSTFAAWQIVEGLWSARDLGLPRITVEQPPYNLLDRRIERELLPMATTFGIAIVVWSPLARGFLTGRFSQGSPLVNTRLADNPHTAEDHQKPPALRVLEALSVIAADRGVPTCQVALGFCLARPTIASVILGPRNAEQLDQLIPAAGVRLSAEEMQRLDEVAKPGRAIIPYYEADFGASSHRV